MLGEKLQSIQEFVWGININSVSKNNTAHKIPLVGMTYLVGIL